MNTKKFIWDFLLDLQKNNSKEWMDQHRDRYHEAKDYWIEEVESILAKLGKHDPYFDAFEPKKTMSRINNNRMFHPDKPVYKGHFSFAPMNKTDHVMKVYVAFGPEFTVIGGGVYRPDKEGLQSIREAIDYDASGLLKIINTKNFQKVFGGLADDPTQLKTSPRGFDNDHPHVELLRRKSFTGSYSPTKKLLLKSNLTDLIEEAYLTLQPLNRWLLKAMSV